MSIYTKYRVRLVEGVRGIEKSMKIESVKKSYLHNLINCTWPLDVDPKPKYYNDISSMR
ncbi:hypothetical protein QTP88_022590 [Uroleucon formosanum]